MMETFAEAWVAANTQTPLTEAAAAAADHVSFVFCFSFLFIFSSLIFTSLRTVYLFCFLFLYFFKSVKMLGSSGCSAASAASAHITIDRH